jgi:hypothetical protein
MTETVTVAPAPVAAKTVGQTVDADIAALEARIKALEGNATAFWTKQITWLKANWPHLVSMAFSGFAATKLGIASEIAKLF